MWTLIVVTASTTLTMTQPSLDACRSTYRWSIQATEQIYEAKCRSIAGDEVNLILDARSCFESLLGLGR